MQQFQVEKAVLSNHRIVENNDIELQDDEIKVRIDKFAFTANNITYGVMGEQLSYWEFFPAFADEDQWGVLPVWGFAKIIESNLPALPVDDRLFGYFAPATEVILRPQNISEERFHDGSTHRLHLPPAYNIYRRVYSEHKYKRTFDNERMLLYPLHLTSFCLWDYLQDNNWFDAEQVIVLSASSKTSVGLGYALHIDENSKPSIGLTSERNLKYVRGLWYFDESLSYDELESVDATIPSVIVDMSGNQVVMSRLHQHLGNNMKRCLNVGITHWEEERTSTGIDTDNSEVFFAPGHIQKRLKEWGLEEFEKQSTAFIQQSIKESANWLQVNYLNGLQGLSDVYQDICAGNIHAKQGLVIKM